MPHVPDLQGTWLLLSKCGCTRAGQFVGDVRVVEERVQPLSLNELEVNGGLLAEAFSASPCSTSCPAIRTGCAVSNMAVQGGEVAESAASQT